jgi:hypothetical protein
MLLSSILKLLGGQFPKSKARCRRINPGTPLEKRVARRWFVEQLESRLVPSALATDKTGYAPTDLAVLTGSGFQVGETVDLSVVRDDGTTYTGWTVTDGGAGDLDGVVDGNITTNWSVPMDAPGHSFTATATGETSGSSAQASFSGLTTWVYALPHDYTPGQTANLYAGGFNIGETVDFQINNLTNGNVYTPWSVTDGSANDLDGATDGHIQTGWLVPDDAAGSRLQVTATGETSGLTAANTFTDGPSAPIVTPPANQTADEGTPQSFDLGSFTDANAGPWTVDVNWGDGSPHTTFSQTTTGTITPQSHTYADGPNTYSVTVTVTDSANLSGSASFGVTVNNVPPVVTSLVFIPAVINENQSTSLNGSFSDPGGQDPHTVVIAWGDGQSLTFNLGPSVLSFGKDHQYLDEGSYTANVTVTDTGPGDNGIGTGSATIPVGDAALTAGTASASGGTEGGSPASLTASFTDANTAAPSSDFTVTSINWGDGTPLDTNGTVSGSGGSYSIAGSHSYAQEGAYTLTVVVTDDGGKTATISGTATVGDMAPTVSAVSGAVTAPENVAATNSGSFSDYDEAVTISASTGTVTQSGSQSGTWSWSGTGDELSPYSVTITATNADGSQSTTSFNVSFTDAAPAVAVTSSPTSLAENATASASGTFSDSDDNVTSLTASEGSVTPASPGSTSGAWSWSEAAPLSDGSHTVTITATNADGTTGSTNFTFTVTDLAPTVSAVSGVVVAPENVAATNSGSFSDYDAAVTISASTGTVTQSGSQSGTWSWSGTGDELSPYTVTITATNADGSQSTTSFNVSFTDVAPAVAVTSSPTSLAENATASASGTFSDFDDNVTSLTASEGSVTPASPGSTSGAWSWSEAAPLADGSHTVTITALNVDGSSSTTTFTFTVTDVAPSVAVTSSPTSVDKNTTASASGTFSDYDDAVTISASEGSISQSGSQSGTWSWSEAPPLADGSHTITVTALNVDGSSSTTSFTFTVTEAVPTVGVDNAAVSAAENLAATNSGTFAGFGNAVTITASSGTVSQSGSTSGTWSWSGTGDESSPYTVTITATSADGSQATVPFNVSFTDVAPSVSAASGMVSAIFGSTASNTGTFSDYDGAATISASEGSISQSGSQSGTWSWSESGLAAGSYTVTITATNADNSTAATSFVININYNFTGFLAPVSLDRAFKRGSTVPIKWQLMDADGNLITSLSAINSLTVTGPTSDTVTTLYPGNNDSSGDTGLRNDGNQYIYNWQTKGFATGFYTITATLNDGSNSTITKTIQLRGTGGDAKLVIDASGSGTAGAGALLAGDLTLYVDNSSGSFTTDELARIQDAISGVEALVSAYGTNIFQVDASVGTDANIIVDTSTASAVGGFADGVLGATTEAGEITFIQGWNWYGGADASTIGADQIDFQTVVTHEIGHALGLGHSTDATSVMHATLGFGETRRTMVTADLNVADADSSPSALHVLLPSIRGSVPVAAGDNGSTAFGPSGSLTSQAVLTGGTLAIEADAPVEVSAGNARTMLEVSGQASGLEIPPTEGHAIARLATVPSVTPARVSELLFQVLGTGLPGGDARLGLIRGGSEQPPHSSSATPAAGQAAREAVLARWGRTQEHVAQRLAAQTQSDSADSNRARDSLMTGHDLAGDALIALWATDLALGGIEEKDARQHPSNERLAAGKE